jgi:hypothetical protein
MNSRVRSSACLDACQAWRRVGRVGERAYGVVAPNVAPLPHVHGRTGYWRPHVPADGGMRWAEHVVEAVI